jgi:hypothetical protein
VTTTHVAYAGCDIVVTDGSQVFGMADTITYCTHDESTAVQGSIVFSQLSTYPEGFAIQIDRHVTEGVSETIILKDTSFTDRIELNKTMQFAASESIITRKEFN